MLWLLWGRCSPQLWISLRSNGRLRQHGGSSAGLVGDLQCGDADYLDKPVDRYHVQHLLPVEQLGQSLRYLVSF